MKKILIAENKKEIRNLLNIILRLSGYKGIYFAKNSEACVRKARKLNPDLILLDEQIPGKNNGEGILSIIKNDRSTSQCSVIILSGNGEKRNRVNLKRMGAAAMLPLRFNPLKLVKTVSKCLGDTRSSDYQDKEYTVSFLPSEFSPVVYTERI